MTFKFNCNFPMAGPRPGSTQMCGINLSGLKFSGDNQGPFEVECLG